MGVIGTPEEAIDQIERLIEQSDGGFGAYLMFAHNWANWEDSLHHYHLFANYVMPHFKGTLKKLKANEEWARTNRDELAARQWKAINDFKDKHTKEPATAPAS